jgi:ComF family protein
MIRALLNAVVAAVIAPSCAACGDPLETPAHSAVCAHCWAAIRPLTPPFCRVCGDPVTTTNMERCPRCCRRRSTITWGRAVGEYDGTLRSILHALKYDRRTSLAPALSALMRTHGQAALIDADLVVPVPLHWRRQWQRGFNQATELARGLGLPLVRALRRRKHTRSQTDLPADERQANVRDAFVVRRPERLRGACVVVVDDVSTTGATLEACANALIRAGVREVRALTAARVVTRQPSERRPGHRLSDGHREPAAIADRPPAPDNCP